jgi:hypothetical protein
MELSEKIKGTTGTQYTGSFLNPYFCPFQIIFFRVPRISLAVMLSLVVRWICDEKIDGFGIYIL